MLSSEEPFVHSKMWIEFISKSETLTKVAEMLETFDKPVKMLGVPITPAVFWGVAGYFVSSAAAIIGNFIFNQS